MSSKKAAKAVGVEPLVRFADWSKQLFWLIGNLYFRILIFDFKEARECYYFIRIHQSFEGKCVSKSKQSLRQQIKSWAYALFGFCVTIIIFVIIARQI